MSAKPSTCTVYKTACAVHGFIHGAEASELREGIEKLIEEYNSDDENLSSVADDLQRLLDRVDARDSVARLEHQLPKRKKR